MADSVCTHSKKIFCGSVVKGIHDHVSDPSWVRFCRGLISFSQRDIAEVNLFLIKRRKRLCSRKAAVDMLIPIKEVQDNLIFKSSWKICTCGNQKRHFQRKTEILLLTASVGVVWERKPMITKIIPQIPQIWFVLKEGKLNFK